jgi:hypothetical protein
MNAFTDHRDSDLLIVRYYALFSFQYSPCYEAQCLWYTAAFSSLSWQNFLLLSHFSLLLGCALPIWMSSGYNDRPLAPFAGILSLGIGDTMVSPLSLSLSGGGCTVYNCWILGPFQLTNWCIFPSIKKETDELYLSTRLNAVCRCNYFGSVNNLWTVYART